MGDFPPRFDAKEAEPRLYTLWESKDGFRADPASKKPAYTIVIPPPNVTGSLHIGHALNNTLQDILIRWKRMDGHEALWIPGTDHAGIATQNVVEKELKKEGKTRHQVGRDEFLKRVWAWKEQYGSTILYQLRRLGCSCDWSRTRFTMDEPYSRAIRTVFVSLFKKGFIYRGLRPINWCPKDQTAISDLEVKRAEGGSEPGKLWHIKYPLADGSGSITVATTRPETMLGDTAVMVHPKDRRYAAMVGKKVKLPFVNREIPVIADDYVDMEFGSGAVKVTPAHDVNDFEVSKRHQLPAVVVMDTSARMNENAGPFKGLERFEARKQVVEKLKELAILEKEEDHATPLGRCDRCDTIIEPYLSEQWFVRMKELAAPAIPIVRRGEVKFHPERWSKVYLDWMENIQDWCISRQLWWGHRIPVWYCACGEPTAAVEAPPACPKCNGKELKQDEDVLDTWFSSGLWPFATLGWPDATADLEKFYPTQTLVTGRDIIFLWVARMIVTGLEFMEEKPYADVVINATILDDAGQRMSKSKGTGVDPLNLLDLYGADALRFALALIPAGTQDFRFGKNLSIQRTEQARNFTTKLWNAARFVAMNVTEAPGPVPDAGLKIEDRWILSRLNTVIGAVTDSLGAFEFGKAADALYTFAWDDFCDWYIEQTKNRMSEPAVKSILVHVVTTTLRLLHPVIPFITEELWQRYHAAGLVQEPMLMRAGWPAAEAPRINAPLEKRMAVAFEVVRGIRDVRMRFEIGPKEKLSAVAKAGPEDVDLLNKEASGIITNLANLSSFAASADAKKSPGTTRWTGPSVDLFVQIAGQFDKAKELARSTKEVEQLEAQSVRSKGQLANEAFRKAKPEMAAEMEKTLVETERKITERKAHITDVESMK